MAENSGDLSLGYMMGQSDGGNNGGWNGMAGIWPIIALAILFGRGGVGGGGGIFGGGGDGCGCQTAVSNGFALNGLENGIRGIQQGICDGFYAVNTGLLTGFNGIQALIAQCCCDTQRGIDSLRYDMATGFCNLGNTIQSSIRDVIDNQNANYRGIMDFMVQEKLAGQAAEIASLKGALGRAEDRSFLAANQEAQTAELIRRLRTPEAVPAFVVPNPNCCYGNPTGVGYGYNGGCGGGCGCGC